MKYFGQTFSYLKKNFVLPIAAFAVPALVACFLSTPYWEVVFVTEFGDTPYITVSQTFRLMFGDSWQYVWPVIVIAVVQVFGAAFMMSAMDRHFRTGKLLYGSSLRLINNSIFPIALGVAIMSVFSIIWRFVLFGIVMLVQVSAEAMSMVPGAAIAVIAAVAVGAFVLHVVIVSQMLFWAPVMFIYGYKFRDAAAASFKLMSGQRLFTGLLLPMMICVGIQMLVGFSDAHAAVSVVMNFFVFLFTNAYTTAHTMLSFYGISELERRDVKPYKTVTVPHRKEQKQEKQEKYDKQEQQKQDVEQMSHGVKHVTAGKSGSAHGMRYRSARTSTPKKSAKAVKAVSEKRKTDKNTTPPDVINDATDEGDDNVV